MHEGRAHHTDPYPRMRRTAHSGSDMPAAPGGSSPYVVGDRIIGSISGPPLSHSESQPIILPGSGGANHATSRPYGRLSNPTEYGSYTG